MNSYNLENEERKNRTNAFILTFLINVAMLFLFWTITVWSAEENKKKDEVLAGGGFVMNYGTDKAGSGTNYSRNKANKSPELVDSKPAEDVKKTKVLTPVVEPEISKNKLVPTKKEVEQPLISSTKASTVKYKEVKDTKVDKKEKIKPIAETKKVANKPAAQPVIDNSALFPVKKANGSNGTAGTNPKPGGASDGNSKGLGNQGQPEGRSVSDAEYKKRPPGDGSGGNGGNGSGNGDVNIAGWTWNSRPVVDDDSNDTGIIKFKVTIDSDGDVVDISLIESTVTPNVMRKYKSVLQRTKFRPTTSNEKTPHSTGTVIFRLNSR